MLIVAVLAQPETIGFEVMTPGQVFGMANIASETEGGAPLYDIRICAPGREVSTVAEWGAAKLRTAHGLEGARGSRHRRRPGSATFPRTPASRRQGSPRRGG